MDKFDLHFECEHGKYGLKEARKIPTMDELNETLEVLAKFGLGKVKRIIIDKIK